MNPFSLKSCILNRQGNGIGPGLKQLWNKALGLAGNQADAKISMCRI
ncbi:hypothetical protein B0O44_102215 [Pedobacter nutrimenti]|uniref:Uncharacterized protein n=1 Tax=Pedobacter nutrimenti TaxID=1241337 RepID=A0A318UHP9_9SPHI|nr:hypothetical protein B0O44_102215 [Pedobacter nutrimenti]